VDGSAQQSFVSGRTFALALSATALAALLESVSAAFGEGALASAVVLLVEGLYITALGGVVLSTVSRMVVPLNRTCWGLVGVAVVSPGVADISWGLAALAAGESIGAPWYSVSFYVLSNVAVAAACMTYALHYRETVDLQWPAMEALVTTVALGLLTWTLVLRPVLSQAGGSIGDVPTSTLIDSAFGLLDLTFYVFPAMFVLLTVVRVGGGGSMREIDRTIVLPWALLTLGAFTLTVSDIGWFWQRALSLWGAGSIVDFAYMFGFVVIATGAAVALDAERAAANRGNGRQKDRAGPSRPAL